MSRYFSKQRCVTDNQAKLLSQLGYRGPIVVNTATIFRYRSQLIKHIASDDAIDYLRKKFNVVIYNSIEPFVDPTSKKILYRYSVKYCNLRDGWNGRIYIGESTLTKNIYSAKRQAIWLAIRWIKKHQKKSL